MEFSATEFEGRAFGMAGDRGARIIDYEARKDVEILRQQVTAHEKICEVRQGEIRRDVASLKADFLTLGGRLDKWMYGVIGLLVASLAYFITRFGLPGA